MKVPETGARYVDLFVLPMAQAFKFVTLLKTVNVS